MQKMVLSILIDNTPGALSRVVGLLAGEVIILTALRSERQKIQKYPV